MMKLNWECVERFLKDGQAFLPLNLKDKGDVVQLFLKDGAMEVLDIRLGAFLKKILDFFGTSISANRNRYGVLVDRKQLVPIALSYGLTLVPYNTREPIGSQSRVGWFFSKEITSFRRKSSRQTIIGLSQHEILAFHSKKFCFDQFKNAKCIELYYREIHEPHRKKIAY